MIIAQGLTDDLFPPSESIRFYNRTKSEYRTPLSVCCSPTSPSPAPLEPNEQGRPATWSWVTRPWRSGSDYYPTLPKPDDGVTAMSMICPYSEPSGGPHVRYPGRLRPGEMRLSDPAKG